MNLFTKNTFRNFALSMLSAAVLSACGGAGSCTNCNTTPSGTLSLSIAAPSQYPAGVAVTAYLTMTNTSTVNGNNLVYTIPSDTNYTGVTITANPTGAGEDCTNIAAGASCTFTASIPSGSKPGSFTVLATPNSAASAKTTQSGKSFQVDSISVTANLGLVDVPNTQNQYYILPSDQTITANANGATTVMISVWVKQASEGLSSLRLVDETGAALSYVTVGTPSYALNSVNTYQVTIPAGKTLQHIQALSNVCETLNNGDNNYTACSNDADVNLATQGHGILSIQPTQFNLSESYESQVITLTNIGTGNVGSISYPTFSSPFSVVTNNCSSITTLVPGQSCTLIVKYTAGSSSGQITPVFGYDDDNNAATEPKNTAITIGYAAATDGPGPGPTAPFSILSVTPTSASLTGENPRKVFTITNTPGGSTAGVTIAGGWTLPTLSAPLELESTNCYASDGSVGLGEPVPMSTKALAVGASCTYTIKYSSAAEAGSASLAFTYNNGITAGEVTNVAVDWASFPAIAVTAVLSSDSAGAYPVTQVSASSSFYAVFTLTGGDPVPARTYTATAPSGFTPSSGNCSISSVSHTCYVKFTSIGASVGNQINFSGPPTVSPASLTIDVTPAWVWINGESDSSMSFGVYGTKGVPNNSNMPGDHYGSSTWRDSDNNLWLFGGQGLAASTGGYLNDLWRYNPSTNQWTWVNGTNVSNQAAVYGTKGVSSTSNMPSTRYRAVSWIDSHDNLWLFGGQGYDSGATTYQFNDLWKYSPSLNQWTWVSGSNLTDQLGVYGTKGTANNANVPGARSAAVSWIDSSGNFWLFGGYGYSASGVASWLNDLWKYDPGTNQWTWVSGTNTTGQAGIYGTKGVSNPSNMPGSRYNAISWVDASGKFWLFGGGPFGQPSSMGYLNDLWRYDPVSNEWTWISGSSQAGQAANYGTKGVPSASNVPSGRMNSVGWIDSSSNLFLLGGGNPSVLNDLWKYDPKTGLWTWVSGSTSTSQLGVYGLLGVGSSTNAPGGRSEAAGWTDTSGNFWLFGGNGFGASGGIQFLNDLWKYYP